MGAKLAPPQFAILDSEDKAGSRLRPERSQKKKRVREEEEEEVVKTPCKKGRKAGSKKDQPPPGLGKAVQSSAEDSQIVIEKPQTPSVRSFLIKANTGTHELGLREGFRGKINSMSMQQSGANGLNSKLGGSLKGKGRSGTTSMNEECNKRHGFQSGDQITSFSKLQQIAPN